MATASVGIESIEQRTARIVEQYGAQGELELMFCRQIASSQTTYESLERLLDKLNAAEDPDDRRIDRVTRAQSRAQRMGTLALKELKDLQDRRGLIARFHDQTKDCPPLANHAPFVGHPPKVKPFPPALRGRVPSPTDHSPIDLSKRESELLRELHDILAM